MSSQSILIDSFGYQDYLAKRRLTNNKTITLLGLLPRMVHYSLHSGLDLSLSRVTDTVDSYGHNAGEMQLAMGTPPDFTYLYTRVFPGGPLMANGVVCPNTATFGITFPVPESADSSLGGIAAKAKVSATLIAWLASSLRTLNINSSDGRISFTPLDTDHQNEYFAWLKDTSL
jgi:hypothetical protein